jgi:hypothetical protein
MKIFKQAIVALFVCLSTFASADTIDLSLSSSGWISGGNSGGTQSGPYMDSGVGVQTATGAQTISCCGSNTWVISPYTGSTMVGMQPGSTQNYSAMTTGLGLSSTSVTALNAEVASQGGSITSTSWISKNFTFSSAATFKMAWVYTSTDYVPFNDGSITTLVNNNSATTLGKINGVSAQYILLGATNPGTGNYSTGSYGSTGWQLANYEIITPGTYKLGFGIFNQGDTALSPVLFVNDGLGTVTKNGATFGAVTPNNPNMPTVDPTTPTGPATPSTPSAPTVVSTATGTPVVTTSSINGTPIVTQAIAFGAAATVIDLANSRGQQSAKTLAVTQTTTATTTTPFTLTTTTTVPVTTTTSTTPVTVTTYSDGSVVNTNGTATVTVNTVNNATSNSVTGNEIDQLQTQKDYTTRIDQYDYLAKANQRLNQQLNSDVMDRQEADGYTIRPRSTLYGNEDKGWFYMNYDGQRSNTTSDGYSLRGQRFGVGYEKKIASNHLVGAQFNTYSGTLNGQAAGGAMDKQHIGLYSLYVKDDWIVKSDLGYAYNNFSNSHSLPELGLNNNGKTNGQDMWASARIYIPEWKGVRPYAGARVENNHRGSLTEGGSTVSAMTYDGVSQTRTSAEAGVRFDKELFDKINLITEAGRTTSGITSMKAGFNYSPGKNVVGGVTLGQQQQDGVKNTTAQASVRVFF